MTIPDLPASASEAVDPPQALTTDPSATQSTAKSPRQPASRGLVATLAHGGGSALMIKVVGTGASFAATTWLARWLGEVGYGDYAYTQSWVTILVMFATLGFDTAAVRYIASYQAQGEWGLLRGFMQRCRQWTAIGTVSLAILMGAISWAMASHLRPELLHTLAVGCVLLLLLAPLQVACSQLRGFKHVMMSQLPLLLVRPLLIAIVVGVMYLFANGHGTAPLALGINAAITLLALLWSAWMVRFASPDEMTRASCQYADDTWRRAALGLLITTSLIVAVTRIDVLMLGSLRTTAQAGIYEVAANITLLVTMGLNSIEVIAAPLIAELYSLKRRDELQRIVWLTACGAFAAALPVALAIVLVGPWLLGLFGTPFQQGYWPMVILAVAGLLNVSAGSTGFLMIMTGHQRDASIIMGVTVLLNVVLNAVFIAWWGMAGAAWATAISTVVWNVAMVVYVWRRLRINATLLPIKVAAR